MTQPFLGQIQCFGFGFAPTGWAQCQGQLMLVSQNTALFALIGTFYGGNGITNFGLPNLQGRVPVGQGQSAWGSYPIGAEGGEENVTLDLTQMPLHSHAFLGSTAPANNLPPQSGSVLATTTKRGAGSPGDPFYGPVDSGAIPINPQSLSFVGNNLAHSNLQPFLTVNWCIALTGIFPQRS